MKVRPLVILLLFVVSAGILVWIYHTATHTRNEPRETPWKETVSDLDACCRRKHVNAVQYEHFADIASDENVYDAARLFRAMALSERVQEHNCSRAILRLGGSYLPPQKVVVFRGTTDDNLRRSIDYEERTLGEHPGGAIERAMNAGNRYAARMLIWATADDLKNRALMQVCRFRRERKVPGGEGYVVCPTCGNLYDTAYCDPYCPFCLTAGQEFVRFE